MFFKKKSFAEKAVKEVSKQLKKEGKNISSIYSNLNYFWVTKDLNDEIIYHEPYSGEEYLSVDYYGSCFDDECFCNRTIPEIIKAISESIKTNYVADYRRKKNLEVHENLNSYILHESSPYNNIVEPTDDDIFSRNSLGIKQQKLLAKGLDDYLNTPGKKFCDLIWEYQRKNNIEGSEVYKPVLMSKQTYSNIISNLVKQPKFESCVQFAFAFKMTFSEAEELFRLAGWAFSDDPYHRIVKYFIEKGNYDIFELNDALYMRSIPPIGVDGGKHKRDKDSKKRSKKVQYTLTIN